ncbi:MAG: FAD:protein FMN transferase [Deltaproteobacteria bacterium]|nr:FAD:protein FMN transferase [Deltaproteobacteria bacterium]
MTLTLSVWADNQPRPVMAVQSAIKALELLGQLAEYQNLLKTPSNKLKREGLLPPLIKRAFSACRKVSAELTGMAAVAGLVGDEIVTSALALGADRVIVNNGGDIALGMKGKQKIRVGLKDPFEERVSHVLEIFPDQGIGGVATSGWGGRSFSPGIADAVSVWAADGATADAAATWIAGEMKLDSPKVVRCPAKELDPQTDIPHLLITQEVGPLSFEEKETVLAAGAAAAKELITRGVIKGAYLAVQGSYRWIASQEPFPQPQHH